MRDATALPYDDESFDAVIISNALHIMPEPEKALCEIKRVLKKDGVLYAPTFIHGNGAAYRLRTRLLELAGFYAYSKWTAAELAEFVRKHGYKVRKNKVLGDTIAPLCYIEAECL